MAIPENELTDGEVLFEEMNLGGIVKLSGIPTSCARLQQNRTEKETCINSYRLHQTVDRKKTFVRVRYERKKATLLIGSRTRQKQWGKLCHFFLQCGRLI